MEESLNVDGKLEVSRLLKGPEATNTAVIL